MRAVKCVTSIASVLCLAAVGMTSVPHEANAWWRYGYGGVRVWVPPVVVVPAPVVVAPPVVYAAPPVVYAAPGAVWVAPYWNGRGWIRGHYRR